MLVEFYLFLNLGLNPLIGVRRFHRLRPIVGVWSEEMDEISRGGCYEAIFLQGGEEAFCCVRVKRSVAPLGGHMF